MNVIVKQHPMMSDSNNIVITDTSVRPYIIYTGLRGMIEMDIIIACRIKGWTHPRAQRSHPPFVKSEGRHIGVAADCTAWRYHRVEGVTYWIPYGHSYRSSSKFNLWEQSLKQYNGL